MNSIRMVWIISRHYNRDERMVPLMSRIAWELANKVSNIVNIQILLREPLVESKQKILDAKSLLESWSSVNYIFSFLASQYFRARPISMFESELNNLVEISVGNLIENNCLIKQITWP